MIKSIKILFFLFILSNNLFAITDSTKFRFGIRVSPLASLHLFSNCIQIGIQTTLFNSLAIGFDYGQYISGMEYTDYGYDKENRYFYKLRGEIKLFLNDLDFNSKKNRQFYMGVEGLYIPESYSKSNNWMVRDDKSFHYDFANIWRIQTAFCGKFGVERWLSKKIIIDFYFGFGFRMISTKYSLYGERENSGNYHANPYFSDKIEGSITVPHFLINFKFCYFF